MTQAPRSRIYRDRNGREAVLVLQDGIMGMALLCGGELELYIHRRGRRHRAEAVDIAVYGGHLPIGSRSAGCGLFIHLLRLAQQTWSGRSVHCCPPDARRMRIYQRIARRAGVAVRASEFPNCGGWLEFTL